MRRLDCLIAVEPFLSESVYQIFLVADFEVFAFAFAGEVEPVYGPCLSVHESSGVLFAETCACHSDYMVIYLIWYGIEMGVCKIDRVLSDDVFDGKCLAIDLVFHGHCAEDQEDNSDSYQHR